MSQGDGSTDSLIPLMTLLEDYFAQAAGREACGSSFSSREYISTSKSNQFGTGFCQHPQVSTLRLANTTYSVRILDAEATTLATPPSMRVRDIEQTSSRVHESLCSFQKPMFKRMVMSDSWKR